MPSVLRVRTQEASHQRFLQLGDIGHLWIPGATHPAGFVAILPGSEALAMLACHRLIAKSWG